MSPLEAMAADRRVFSVCSAYSLTYLSSSKMV